MQRVAEHDFFDLFCDVICSGLPGERALACVDVGACIPSGDRLQRGTNYEHESDGTL